MLRHPARAFPGVLLQGDTLYILYKQANLACSEVGPGAPGYEELDDLRNKLQLYLDHYKSVLKEHGMKLPFFEAPLP
ncbi:DUF6959 family protein [Rhizobium sp. KDH_Rht_773_N]